MEQRMQQVQRLFGCGGFARYLGVTETAVRLMRIPPDALVDGRKAWTEQTVRRVKAERDARRSVRAEAAA
jgi:hypothetical protein